MTSITPARAVLGSGSIAFAGEELARINAKHILILCGGFRRRNPDKLEKLCDSLDKLGQKFWVYDDIEANCNWKQAVAVIRFAREKKVDTILAIGGGSVIDMAKAVAFGVPVQCDVFDLYNRDKVASSALGVIAIPTTIGTGSEGSDGGVLTKGKRKLTYGSDFGTPVTAILDPDLLTGLNDEFILCGLGDAISHVLERYFCGREGQMVDLADEFLLIICKALIKYVRKLSVECKQLAGSDLEQLMWICHIAHNGYLSVGKRGDWASHAIAHELETISGCKHGHAVGLVFPYWVDEIYPKRMSMCKKLNNTLGADLEVFKSPESTVLKSDLAISLQGLFSACGAPKTLKQVGIERRFFGTILNSVAATTKSGTIGNLEWLDRK